MIERVAVIVGAGPAGLAAAITLAEAGVQVTLIDENPQVGGQIYRQSPLAVRTVGEPVSPVDAARGADLLQRFERVSSQIELLRGATVWGVFPPRQLAISTADGWTLIAAEQLLLATGAYEYVPPFPGWTLPGVMTPGGAQSLVKIQHVLPGKRAIVAGTGPFLLLVALQLHAAGVQVAGVVELARRRDLLSAGLGLLADPSLVAQGVDYLDRLHRAGIPLHWGHVVVEARGFENVREVVIAPCDAEGRADRRRARIEPAELLAVGYGFVPRIELAQLAGCELRFNDERGGWLPVVDEQGETTVPGVWVAGDGGGVAGAIAAEWTGELAALAIAERLRRSTSAQLAARRQALLRKLDRFRRFRAALDQAYRLRPGLSELADADTLVCRCEELTLREATTGVEYGGVSLRSLKVMTRLGMGPCQGRMCWPAMCRWLAARQGVSPEAIGPASARPPCSPLAVGDLLRTAPLPSQAVGCRASTEGCA